MRGRFALFGENMFGVHQIEYDGLASYFYLFGVHDDLLGSWWSWDQVVELAAFLQLPTVPVLFRGSFATLNLVQKWMDHRAKLPSALTTGGGAEAGALAPVTPEGFVLRRTARFTDAEFSRSISKYVRQGFTQFIKYEQLGEGEGEQPKWHSGSRC